MLKNVIILDNFQSCHNDTLQDIQILCDFVSYSSVCLFIFNMKCIT